MTKALVPKARGASARAARPTSVTQLLLDISLARLLLTLAGVALGPVRVSLRWCIAWWHLAIAARRAILRLLGYMAAPPASPTLRHLCRGVVEVRRWHVAAGAHVG